MILDTLMGQERLLISCNDWRKAGTETGIWEYDFKTKKAKRLTLVFPTAEYKLRPHGIHLVNGHLFIVNHPQKKDSINRNKKRRDRIKQEILRFRVMGDSLVMEVAIRHKLLKRPNDVFATSSSEVYWSNFKLFGGNVCRFSDGKFEKVLRKGRLQNGVHIAHLKVVGSDSIKPYLITSTTIGKHVFRTELFGKKKTKQIGKVKGGDNFSLNQDGTLLLTAHVKLLKLGAYGKYKTDKAPTNVFEIDLSKEKETAKNIYSNDGSLISGCTTAIRYKGFMYLSPLFDSFILRVPLKTQN
ncbi:MAG: hypothetical protein JKY54_12760 [Flavobacteriales bacterium]|nr:hypothetical protein [Flavobacteriales bacterium]